MRKAISAMEYQNNLLVEQGIEQGRFDMALRLKRELGIDKACEISGFSREELEKEKLNNSPFSF